ncbi:MAG: glycosyltransferase [Lachnospiraceae bacterium]|nr:glycosyltransferase [Lachnospiraceae bacterium]
MIKVLFLIHDLGQGGAEKVLINLVNNMDKTKFDITVMSLFAGGVNEQFLSKDVRYITCFKKMIPANSKLMKLLTPKQLHKLLIKDTYDLEISYLEGPCSRIISGCQNIHTKLISWIHVEQHTLENVSYSFRNGDEAKKCYNKFDKIACVSEYVKRDFTSIINMYDKCQVVHNTIESDEIIKKSFELETKLEKDDKIKIIAVGTLKKSKGYERLIRIMSRLINDKKTVHLYILGVGPMEEQLKKQIKELGLEKDVTLLGYDTNPYKYVAKSDVFVCSSFAEGFSTAATEALILGVPVCTVEVSGMKEMLGENNEFGIVTENNEDALYQGIKSLLDDDNLMKQYAVKAKSRSKMFSKDQTVQDVENMLTNILL